MTTILNGVVHGQTIELTEPANLPEGGAVRLVLLGAEPPNGAGDDVQLFTLPPAMQIARAAFLRELPALLADKKSAGKWFLYHRERRVRAAKSQLELVRYCQKQGWDESECYIDMAIPHSPEPETVDPSLFEFEE